MPTHAETFDSARRTAELLLHVQAAGPRGLRAHPLADEWGVSWQTVRRTVRLAVEASRKWPEQGTLERRGQGERTKLVWVPAADTGSRRALRTETVALAASLGPWRAMGIDDVASVLERLLRGAVASLPAERAEVIADLLRRGFHYQAYMPRRMRDPDAPDVVLSALFWRTAIGVARYHSPSGLREGLVLEPWTLVHSLDGLYVVAPRAGTTEPRLWALHRMDGVRRLRDHAVRVPEAWRPEDALGHGYGPFFATPGAVDIVVPEDEAPWVLESPLPAQVGEPRRQADGSWRVRIGIARNVGLELWARANGVEIVEAAGDP